MGKAKGGKLAQESSVLSSQPEILGSHIHHMGHHISADIFSVREFTSLQTILHHYWKTLIWDDISHLGAIIHHQALFSHLFYFAFIVAHWQAFSFPG